MSCAQGKGAKGGRGARGAKGAKSDAPASSDKPKTAAEALQAELDELKQHRKALEDDMKGKLKDAAKETDPNVIVPLLEEADLFGDSLSTEVAAAKSQLDKLTSSAAS